MPRYKKPYSLYCRFSKATNKRYWYYRTYTPAGVRTHGIATGCTSRSAAVRYCDDLLARGLLYTGSAQNFQEYAEHFFDDEGVYVRNKRAAGKLAPSTLKLYRFFNERYFLPILGGYSLEAITYTTILSFRAQLLEDGTAPASVNNIMSILRVIFSYALRDGLIVRDPFIGVDQLRTATTTRDAFTLEEVRRLYSSVDPRAQFYVAFLACTGLRANEARGLQYGDIQTSPHGVQYVQLQAQRLGAGEKLTQLKTKDKRVIPLHPALVELLPRDGFCFPHSYGVYSHASYSVLVQWADKSARSLSLHSLRHFFVTAAKSAGVPDRKVEAIAGHKPVKRIEAVYTNYTADDLAEIIPWQGSILAELGILE